MSATTTPESPTPAAPKKPRKPRLKVSSPEVSAPPAPSPVRHTLRLRPIQKSFFAAIRRFRVAEHLSQVEFTLRSGRVLRTDFVLDQPRQATPHVETYLAAEDEKSFQIGFDSNPLLSSLRQLDTVTYYNEDGQPIFCQEY